MRGDGIHQPLLSQYLVVEVPGGNGKTEARHVGRCFCGWHGPYRARAWETSRDVADHVIEQRRPK